MPNLPGYLTMTRRQTLVALTTSLTSRRRKGASDLDRALLYACNQFCRIERRKLGLIEGPARIPDDEARDAALAPLMAEQETTLDAICDARAFTLRAHRARAAAFCLWDGGELAWRAAANGFLEDQLLSATLRDPVGNEEVWG